ncbi:MAG: DUF3343 domain-containing protein [Clostridia bacterium]|nr:DUF3343 domain-containing protein [Clostridia bacterium]
MNYLLIVFSSRRDATAFYEALQTAGYNAFIINTPRALQLSCGISVKTSTDALPAIRRLLSCGNYDSFVGVYYYTFGRYSKM